MSVSVVVCEIFFPRVVTLRLNLPGEHFEPTSSVMFEAPPEGRAMVVGLKVARTQLGIPETERVSTSESPWNGKTVTVAEAVKPLAPCVGSGDTDTVRLPSITVRVMLRTIAASVPRIVILKASEGQSSPVTSVRTVVLDVPWLSLRGLGGLKL